MKRSELKVGDELYYARYRDWETAPHGGQKVVVLSTEPYRRLSVGYYGPDHKPWRPDPQGALVLVEIHNLTYRHQDVVSLASLKGPYGKVAAEVAARAKTRRDRERALEAKRHDQAAQQQAVIARAERAGVEARTWLHTSASEEYVMLKVDELDRLLDRLEG